jgi:hypothetical protein
MPLFESFLFGIFCHPSQGVEKRYERRPELQSDKAKFDEIAEFIPINEYFESNFNAVLSSVIVFHPLLKTGLLAGHMLYLNPNDRCCLQIIIFKNKRPIIVLPHNNI